MKKIFTLLLSLLLTVGILLAQTPEKPPIEEGEDIEVLDEEITDDEMDEVLIESLDELEEDGMISESMFGVDKSTFRVQQDSFDLHNLLTETDWPENWEGEQTLKDYEEQIFVLDFTGGLDKGVSLKLLEPYISYLDDPEVTINLYYTDEDISNTRIAAIRNNLKNGIPDRPKKIQVWLHLWPDNNLGILAKNPIK